MDSHWPALSAERDGPTIAALHLFSQVAGKVPTRVLPWRNHSWHVTLHVTPRGLRTEPVHAGSGIFELEFDLVGHRLVLQDVAGARQLPLRAMSVSEFYREVMRLLGETGHAVPIHPSPNEVDPAVPFDEDVEPRTYDPDSALRLGQALRAAGPGFPALPLRFPGQGESGPLLLGKLRSGSDSILRPLCTASSRRRAQPAGHGGPRGLFA